MRCLESNLSSDGATRVPKALREALGAPHGGRLIWQLLPDGTLSVTVKHRYVARRAPDGQTPNATIEASGGEHSHACLTNEQGY